MEFDAIEFADFISDTSTKESRLNAKNALQNFLLIAKAFPKQVVTSYLQHQTHAENITRIAFASDIKAGSGLVSVSLNVIAIILENLEHAERQFPKYIFKLLSPKISAYLYSKSESLRVSTLCLLQKLVTVAPDLTISIMETLLQDSNSLLSLVEFPVATKMAYTQFIFKCIDLKVYEVLAKIATRFRKLVVISLRMALHLLDQSNHDPALCHSVDWSVMNECMLSLRYFAHPPDTFSARKQEQDSTRSYVSMDASKSIISTCLGMLLRISVWTPSDENSQSNANYQFSQIKQFQKTTDDMISRFTSNSKACDSAYLAQTLVSNYGHKKSTTDPTLIGIRASLGQNAIQLIDSILRRRPDVVHVYVDLSPVIRGAYESPLTMEWISSMSSLSAAIQIVPEKLMLIRDLKSIPEITFPESITKQKQVEKALHDQSQMVRYLAVGFLLASLQRIQKILSMISDAVPVSFYRSLEEKLYLKFFEPEQILSTIKSVDLYSETQSLLRDKLLAMLRTWYSVFSSSLTKIDILKLSFSTEESNICLWFHNFALAAIYCSEKRFPALLLSPTSTKKNDKDKPQTRLGLLIFKAAAISKLFTSGAGGRFIARYLTEKLIQIFISSGLFVGGTEWEATIWAQAICTADIFLVQTKLNILEFENVIVEAYNKPYTLIDEVVQFMKNDGIKEEGVLSFSPLVPAVLRRMKKLGVRGEMLYLENSFMCKAIQWILESQPRPLSMARCILAYLGEYDLELKHLAESVVDMHPTNISNFLSLGTRISDFRNVIQSADSQKGLGKSLSSNYGSDGPEIMIRKCLFFLSFGEEEKRDPGAFLFNTYLWEIILEAVANLPKFKCIAYELIGFLYQLRHKYTSTESHFQKNYSVHVDTLMTLLLSIVFRREENFLLPSDYMKWEEILLAEYDAFDSLNGLYLGICARLGALTSSGKNELRKKNLNIFEAAVEHKNDGNSVTCLASTSAFECILRDIKNNFEEWEPTIEILIRLFEGGDNYILEPLVNLLNFSVDTVVARTSKLLVAASGDEKSVLGTWWKNMSMAKLQLIETAISRIPSFGFDVMSRISSCISLSEKNHVPIVGTGAHVRERILILSGVIFESLRQTELVYESKIVDVIMHLYLPLLPWLLKNSFLTGHIETLLRVGATSHLLDPTTRSHYSKMILDHGMKRNDGNSKCTTTTFCCLLREENLPIFMDECYEFETAAFSSDKCTRLLMAFNVGPHIQEYFYYVLKYELYMEEKMSDLLYDMAIQQEDVIDTILTKDEYCDLRESFSLKVVSDTLLGTISEKLSHNLLRIVKLFLRHQDSLLSSAILINSSNIVRETQNIHPSVLDGMSELFGLLKPESAENTKDMISSAIIIKVLSTKIQGVCTREDKSTRKAVWNLLRFSNKFKAYVGIGGLYRSSADVLKGFDPKKLKTSSQYIATAHERYNAGVYDPDLVLKTCYMSLIDYRDGKNALDFKNFVSSGFLGYAISSLSSSYVNYRTMGYAVLGEFRDILREDQRTYSESEVSKRFSLMSFKEVKLILYLCNLIHNSSDNLKPIPALMCTFFVMCISILLNPNHDLYKFVTRYLLRAPVIVEEHFSVVEDFLHNNSDLNAARVFVLKLIEGGVRSTVDHSILRRRHCYEDLLLMGENEAIIQDSNLRYFIIQALSMSVNYVPAVGIELIQTHGIFNWIQGLPKVTYLGELQERLRLLLVLLQSVQSRSDLIGKLYVYHNSVKSLDSIINSSIRVVEARKNIFESFLALLLKTFACLNIIDRRESRQLYSKYRTSLEVHCSKLPGVYGNFLTEFENLYRESEVEHVRKKRKLTSFIEKTLRIS